MKLHRKQAGFTLVEIAMVLIVIALLIGGVLKAGEMITNTRLKRIAMDQQGILSAMNLYYGRYREFPGDDPAASSHFTAYVGKPEANGDGDGKIGDGTNWNLDEATPITDGGQESLKFWAHLRAAGFIEGTPDQYTRPHHQLDNGRVGIQSGSLGIITHVLIFSDLDGSYARILDTQHDDGRSDSGPIRINGIADGMEEGDAPAATLVPEDRYHLAWKLPGL